MSRFGCVWVEAFAAAAVERSEPGLRERPLIVVSGAPPATRVVEANAAARERGVRSGMSDAEAGARCAELVRRPCSAEVVAAARHALLEACLAVSPRVEDAGPGLVHVDTAGLRRLVGDDDAVARRLVREVRAVGLEARVGIAATRAAARVAAHVARPVRVLHAGMEAAALAPVPVHGLGLPAEVVERLVPWGVTTLGEIAALPRRGLATRLGQAGLDVYDLACGRDRTPFRVWEPEPFWGEAQGLEWPLESLPLVLAWLERVLERLCARLATAHRWADALDVRLALATGAHHARSLSLAAPMGEARPMLALLALDLEAHPPPAAVTGIALSARVLPRRAVAGGLWQRPAPTVRDLAAVLARLAALVGPARLGAPKVTDSHGPDAFTLAPFAPPAGDDVAAAVSTAVLALRRLRPPRPLRVETDGERPAVVHGAMSEHADVVQAAGPWRMSGQWWDDGAWARDEWDVAMTDGTLARLAHDRIRDLWLLDGVYD